jgi:hypothetical protein
MTTPKRVRVPDPMYPLIYEGGFPANMAPACDRCGKVPREGAVMDPLTLRVVCFECMTMAEKRRLDLGASPFSTQE